jgi:hypothetical protein|nr:MAG TPA: tail tape measure protein [Caudoviricetes sp.]
MAGMKFTADVDLDKIKSLRLEINKLKKSLIEMAGVPNSDAAVKQLERQLEKLNKKLVEYQEKYAKLKKIQDDIGKSNNTTDDVKKSTAALQSTNKWIEANTKAIIEADNQIKIFKKDFDSLSADDKVGSSGTAKLRQIEQVVAKRMAEAESIRKNIKAQKDKIIQDRSEEGSITQLRKQLSLLIVDYDNMGRLRREGGAGKALLAQIKVVQDELSKAEQASGRFQRNVGNYSSAFNGLGMSIQQIARELPTLSMGANMFFLAISNNLPIFFDEVQRARKEYTAYIAELKKGNTDVQKVAPVWKQIASGIFSWNTALTVGVTLLTVYGKDIVEFVSGLFNAEKQLDATARAQKALNEALEKANSKAIESSTKELMTLSALFKTASDTNKSMNERNRAVSELMSKYPAYLGNIEKEKILLGQAGVEYANIANNIKKAAESQAIFNEMVDLYSKKRTSEQLSQKALDFTGKMKTGEISVSDFEIQIGDKKFKSGLFGDSWMDIEKEGLRLKKEAEDYQKQIDSLMQKINSNTVSGYDPNKEAERLRKEAEQKAKETLKIQKSLSEALIQDELKYQAARLELMEEGKQKRLAKSELEYNEQKNALQKEYDDRLAQYKKLNQEMPEGVSQMFVQRGITIREQREQRDENIEKEYQDEILKRQQQLTDVFLSDEDKKIEAIKRRYDSEREWANQNLEGGQLSGYLALINSAEMQEINNLNSDLYKNTEIWSQLFSDLEQYTTSTLQNILVKAKQVNTEGWDPSDIKAWQEAIDKVDKDINRRNPFQGIKKSWEGLMKSIKDGNKDDVGKFMTNLSNGLNEISSMAIQVGDTLTSVFSGGRADGLNEDVKNIVNSVANAGQLAAGIATGNVAGIVSGGLGLATSIGKMFSGKSKAERDSERLAKVTDKIAKTNEIINSLIENRISLIKQANAAEREGLKESSLDIIDRQRKIMEAQFQKLLGNELLGKKGKNNDLDVEDLGISSIQGLVDFLNSDKLVELMENGYGITDKDKWYGIVDEWEKLNEQADQLKETVSEINTGIKFDEARDGLDDLLLSADTTFRDISDNFEGYMRKSVLNMVKSRYLNEEMQKWYDQFEQRTSDGVLSREDTEALRQQYENIYNEAQNKINGMLAAAGVGLEGASEVQESSKKGFAQASQESVDELNGRFTAGQIAWEETKNQSVMQNEKLSILDLKVESLLNVSSEQRNIADETRTILANSYLELQQISENTGLIIKPITEMRDKMNSWDSKIRNM